MIDAQAGRRPGQRRERGAPRQEQRREPEVPTGPVSVPSGITVKDLAEKLGVSPAKIITLLMAANEMVQITQSLSDEAVELIGGELEREIEIRHAADEEAEEVTFEDAPDSLQSRPPVVTIMGHVDHGKTTLLDAIRESAVVATEAGGITQHIGAYQVDVPDGRKVTFLDTPGHEAFTAMRARGAKVTDIAVLVVAADDGVMPQTVEAIDHAKAAKVPIVVAVNKIDLPRRQPRPRAQRARDPRPPARGVGRRHDLRGRLGQGQAEPGRAAGDDPAPGRRARAEGEPRRRRVGRHHRVTPRRGPRARSRRCSCSAARCRVGDAIVAGDAWGKVKALNDHNSKRVREAGPGVPVEILGFDRPPPAGELARVVDNERVARQTAQQRAQRVRAEQLAQRTSSLSLEDLFSHMQEGGIQELALIIKADVQGSVEAAVDEIAKIQHAEVSVRVIHSGVGGIVASDIMLAAASNAIVVGFNVRPNAEAKALAEREGVDIRTYRVIYKLTEDIQQALLGMLAPEQVEEVLGEAEVRQIFRASRIGTIAGCMVTQGVIQRGAQVRVVRDGTIVFDGRSTR